MRQSKFIRPSILIGAISFVFAVVLGVWRIALMRGFVLPSIPEWFPPHGNLIVGGFLGTLIIFERMLVLPIGWLAWVPYLWGISVWFLHLDNPIVKVLHILSLVGWGIHRWLAYKTFKNFMNPFVEFLSYVLLSSSLLFENGLAGKPESALAGLSFAIAAIGVERIELTLGFGRKFARVVYAGLLVLLSLWFINVWIYAFSIKIMGIILILVSVGMILNDPVAIGLKVNFKTPMHRFLRETLRVAYFWLLVSGTAMILWDELQGLSKDIVFHSIGLGFIFSMILSHAPIVMGSASGRTPRGNPPRFTFYAFQFLTLIRILADVFVVKFSTFTKIVEIWMWSGWITGTLHFLIFVAHLLFIMKSFKQN